MMIIRWYSTHKILIYCQQVLPGSHAMFHKPSSQFLVISTRWKLQFQRVFCRAKPWRLTILASSTRSWCQRAPSLVLFFGCNSLAAQQHDSLDLLAHCEWSVQIKETQCYEQ